MSNHTRPSAGPAQSGAESGWQASLLRFARDYGWWRVFAIPVLAVITVWVLVDVFRPDPQPSAQITEGAYATTARPQAGGEAHGASASEAAAVGPDPAQASAVQIAKDQLPAGGAFTERGANTYHEVGMPGKEFGEGAERTVRYAIEVEDGIDTSAYGGDDAFAAMVDATLSDPRSWSNDKNFKFIHVASNDNPDTKIRLTSLATTAELCGAQLESETSCHTGITGESTVIINEARWVRGAVPYEGDLGSYRQYLINHEFGHAIGYADHQACGADGALAPVMMQQTLSLNNSELYAKDPTEVYPDNGLTCEPNPWPYPQPSNTDVNNPSA